MTRATVGDVPDVHWMRLVLVALALLIVSGAATAVADDATLARAIQLVREDRTDRAHDLFVEIVEADGARPRDLAVCGRWALVLGDGDLLGRVRALAEAFEIAGGEQGELDVALGCAYLGLAEMHLQRRTGGSSVSLLFADAEARAGKLSEAQAALGAWLAARSRYAQGDPEGAITRIGAYRGADDESGNAALNLLEGSLRYERAAAQPLGEDGRPTAAARADLERASLVLERAASPSDPTDFLVASERRSLALLRAWTAHRLGRIDEARALYVAAHVLGLENARLARRGLASLFGNDPTAHLAVLEMLAEQTGGDTAAHLAVLDAIVAHHRSQKRTGDALIAVQRRISADENDPVGWTTAGMIFGAVRQWGEAISHFERALALDGAHQPAARGMEQVALALASSDFERALETYERLLARRPSDPYVRNNLGFLLRERVSPWTDFLPGGIQKLKVDAPPRALELLIRCRDVYAAAVLMIPEDEDESRDLLESWNLAGIVNDYGLMLHYFADIQDAALAEQMYLRTLRMTDDGFKDTYSPNLQRLYTFVLTDRELVWYRLARRSKDAILAEKRVDGALELVPDRAKRGAADRDERRLRARIVQELKADADEDEAPWPPGAPGGTGR